MNGNKWEISTHLDYIGNCLLAGHSIRMISRSLGIDHSTLSKAMKAIGISVPSRNESAKYTWKNHKHPRLGVTGPACPVFGHKMSDEIREKMCPTWERLGSERRFGKKMHSGGYVLVYCPNHSTADQTGYVLEHRLVVESAIGRELLPKEIVHHINGIKDDNRPENLTVLTRAQHARIHMYGHLEEVLNA